MLRLSLSSCAAVAGAAHGASERGPALPDCPCRCLSRGGRRTRAGALRQLRPSFPDFVSARGPLKPPLSRSIGDGLEGFPREASVLVARRPTEAVKRLPAVV